MGWCMSRSLIIVQFFIKTHRADLNFARNVLWHALTLFRSILLFKQDCSGLTTTSINMNLNHFPGRLLLVSFHLLHLVRMGHRQQTELASCVKLLT